MESPLTQEQIQQIANELEALARKLDRYAVMAGVTAQDIRVEFRQILQKFKIE